MKSVRMFRRCWVCVIGMAVLLSLPPVVRAQVQTQEPPPAAAPPVESAGEDSAITDSESGDRRLPLETVAPYSTWKHHTAQKPEDALIRVRCTPAGGGAEAVATGLMIRCDGFILLPQSVWEMTRNGGSLSVTLTGVDGVNETLNRGGAQGHGAATSPASAPPAPSSTAVPRLHRHTNATVPYALVKTNGYHSRSLPLLDSGTVVTGNAIRVLWFGTGTRASGASGIRVLRGAVGPAEQSKDTFSIVGTEDSAGIPVGAVVVDAESGAAAGVVTEAGAKPAFVTFARFNLISSEVGLAPDRAAVRLGDRPGALPNGSPEMVWVPGGPVALDGEAEATFQRDYGTSTVCTPGFWMAVQPVTNGEYNAWLRGKWRALPYGWTDQDVLVPTRRPDRPACGMFPPEATLFAASRRSRLPTEVEWRRAAFTRDTAWVEEIKESSAQDEKNYRIYFNELYNRYFVALETAVSMASSEVRARAQAARIPVPRSILIPLTPELADVVTEIRQARMQVPRDQWRWGQVGPIDAFRQDRSVFGVRNVLMNAPELVNSRLNEALNAPKRYPATEDPDLTQYRWRGTDWVAEANAVARNPALEDQSYLSLTCRGFRELTLMGFWQFGEYKNAGMTYDTGSGQGVFFGQVSARRQIHAGFRCAR
ncbi:MAG: SUMF1/EgtB/PvdO family nonheme iron enzyme [Armatimonadota bacterium]